MHSASLFFTVALGLLTSAPDRGTALNYQGRFFAVKGNTAESEKRFTLQAIVQESSTEATSIWWTLTEQRFGSWGWADHFGQMQISLPGKTQSVFPALLYDRGDGKSVIPLTPPIGQLPAGNVEKGQQWENDKLQCTVLDGPRIANRECWKVEMRNAFGLKRTLFVDKQQGFVVAMRERTFIGQGEEHELHYELTSQESLSDQVTAQVASGFEKLSRLREQLNWQPRRASYAWNEEELALLKREVAGFADLANLPPLKELVVSLENDVKQQRGRAGAVSAFREKLLGRDLGDLKLTGLAGAELNSQLLRDKVTVLHFWEYKDAPLEEPYGQVGYLDFLNRRMSKKGVQVIGIAVDADGNDPAVRRRTLAAAGKLKSFMNLGYNIVADDAELLKRIGDPRVAGGKLPLFVVIGKDGKVLEYRSGHYDVHANRGLAELEDLITKAVGSRE